MRRLAGALVLAAGLSGLPFAVSAAPIDVTYEVRSGNGGPPNFTALDHSFAVIRILSGSATVRYYDPNTAGSFPAEIRTFSARFTALWSRYPDFHYRGDIYVTGGLQAPGVLTAGGFLQLPLNAMGSNGIVGAYCPPDYPCSMTRTRLYAIALDFLFTETNAFAKTTWADSGDLGYFYAPPTPDASDVLSGVIRLTEVARTVVPEPGTGVLLSSALALILTFGVASGRRARRH